MNEMMVLRLVCKGKILLAIVLAIIMCLHSSMQEEDILECIFSQLVDHCET
jgi:hypothetical protein